MPLTFNGPHSKLDKSLHLMTHIQTLPKYQVLNDLKQDSQKILPLECNKGLFL